jgi:hypothetical protein
MTQINYKRIKNSIEITMIHGDELKQKSNQCYWIQCINSTTAIVFVMDMINGEYGKPIRVLRVGDKMGYNEFIYLMLNLYDVLGDDIVVYEKDGIEYFNVDLRRMLENK